MSLQSKHIVKTWIWYENCMANDLNLFVHILWLPKPWLSTLSPVDHGNMKDGRCSKLDLNS